ncbi:MAG TPA: SGNH/GDSL hydrolase family protein, partial [Gemmatimonadaceae bacterium]|nr:SGNH/GDSL hydrolase family protein [Gemmatimonadaceae bacterium]
MIFSLLPALVLLGCAELLATLTIDRRTSRVTDPATGRVSYTMQIGRLPWGRTSVTPLNALGFPDEEFSSLDKGPCVHVVVAGDSFVFGDGVDRDSSFVSLVKRWARARPGRCVRILNVAERGTTIDQQARRIRETFDVLRPDVVILGQYQNDLTDLTNPGAIADTAPARDVGARARDPIRDRLAAFNANLVRLLSYHAFAFMIRRGIEYDVLARWSVLADSSRSEEATRLKVIYESQYEELVKDLTARGVAFGVIILPSKFDILAKRFPEEQFFLSLANRYAAPYLRVFPVVDANRSPYPFLMYDGHLNEIGNRLVATALYRW